MRTIARSIGVCFLAVLMAGCSAEAQQPGSAPARICDQNGCRDNVPTEQSHSSAFDFDAFMARVEQAGTIEERQAREDEIDEELERLEREYGERFRLESRVIEDDQLSEERAALRERRESSLATAPLRCRRNIRSFVAPLRGSLTCGDAGAVFPGLFDGDCPISACILKARDDANPFGGPLDFGD